MMRRLRKCLSRALLIVGLAGIHATTPGCQDPTFEEVCLKEGARCGGNDPACCTGLECVARQAGDRVFFECVPWPPDQASTQ